MEFMLTKNDLKLIRQVLKPDFNDVKNHLKDYIDSRIQVLADEIIEVVKYTSGQIEGVKNDISKIQLNLNEIGHDLKDVKDTIKTQNMQIIRLSSKSSRPKN